MLKNWSTSKFDGLNGYILECEDEFAPIVYASYIKSGKSTILKNDLLYKLKLGAKALFISTELDETTFKLSLLPIILGEKIERSKLKKTWNNNKDIIESFSLDYVYNPNVSSLNYKQVYEYCKNTRKKMGLDIIFYDHIKDDADVDNLRKISMVFDVPVIASAILKKDEELFDENFSTIRYDCACVIQCNIKREKEQNHKGNYTASYGYGNIDIYWDMDCGVMSEIV